MPRRSFFDNWLSVLSFATLLMLPWSCKKEVITEPTDPLVREKLTKILQVADKADGQVDKVVTQCALCQLGMDGRKEHTERLMEYELHFCSSDCKKRFRVDPTQSLLKLKAIDPSEDDPE